MSGDDDMVGRAGPKGKVVIVDNEPARLAAASDLLTAEGYDVSSASSIDRALNEVEERHPDVILFGIQKPPESAIDFARRLALKGAIRLTPVVMVTGLDEYQVDSFLNGVPGLRRLLKAPYAPDALCEEIAHALQHAHR